MTSASIEIAEIQQRMQQVRGNMGVDVLDLVENARTMTDWRRYWRRHPWAWCGIAATVGYFFMPSRRFGNADVQRIVNLQQAAAGMPPARRTSSLLSELMGIALGIAMQQGKELVVRQVTKAWDSRAAVQRPPRDPSGTVRGRI